MIKYLFYLQKTEVLLKSILYFILFCSLFGCKKNDVLDCRLISMSSGIPVLTTTYEYDRQGRIIKFSDISSTVRLSYYSDSIVAIDGNSNTTFYLNAGGLATFSKLRYTNFNPNEIAWDKTYIYNNEGYLIQERDIFSHLSNGNIVRDTGFISFTIQNGNIVKYSITNALEYNYQYSNIEAKQNMAFTTHPLYQWPFLGKPSKNLLSGMTPPQTLSSSFSYEFDSKGNVTKRMETTPNMPGPIILNYNYLCN